MVILVDLDELFASYVDWNNAGSGDMHQQVDSEKVLENNQGRERCFKCNTLTVKVASGMYTVYDVCPKCKI